jgi:outer membrane protein assembly factor BamA
MRADARGYYNPFSRVVLAARLKYGAVSSHAPFWEKFYLGGPNSLRGYDDRSLSPTGGGDRLYQAGLELRFPIGTKNYPKHLLTAAFFYDAGANVSVNQSFNKDALYQGLGFGLRLRLPYLGIIRMDMAYPVEFGSKQIQISLGHTF